MFLFRRSYCIITAPGIVTLCKRPYSTQVRALYLRTIRPFTESDDTRCCNNTIWPPEDEHSTARNTSRIITWHIYCYRIKELCIKLAIQTSLYMMHGQKNIKFYVNTVSFTAIRKLWPFLLRYLRNISADFLHQISQKNRAINAKYTDRNSLTPQSKVRLLLHRHRLSSQLLVEIRWKLFVSCCIRIGWRMWSLRVAVHWHYWV
jgi:hypothetical protein